MFVLAPANVGAVATDAVEKSLEAALTAELESEHEQMSVTVNLYIVPAVSESTVQLDVVAVKGGTAEHDAVADGVHKEPEHCFTSHDEKEQDDDNAPPEHASPLAQERISEVVGAAEFAAAVTAVADVAGVAVT
jgi:hypothetical protein